VIAPLLTRSASLTDQEYFTLLLRLADRLEGPSRRRIEAAVEQARAGIAEEAIAEALRTLNTDAVLRVLLVDRVAEGLATAAVAVSREMIAGAGPLVVDRLSAQLAVQIEWEAVSHRAFVWVRRHGAELVTQIGESTREALAGIVEHAFREPLSQAATAKLIRGAVGLNAPQSRALDRYWRDLAAAVGDGTISQARAAQLGERYRQRLLKHRAMVITRQESATAGNQAQREVWRAVPEADAAYVREAVAIMKDGRICAGCHERHGWRAPIGGAYQDGSDGPPWVHVTCRCGERLVAPDDPSPSRPAFVEPESGGTLRPLIE
jgi:hypothetical protein